jgi:2-keto-4-pentenoate hydratase/2-oxohepta-3-ene-1,7-dioic acid hydratase in catechol pathway
MSHLKIICIGRNYIDHAKELNNPVPAEPVVFLKPASSLNATGIPVKYPEFTANLQYECEIVLKISKTGKNIPLKAALEYFDQWTVGLDFTARDLQQTLKEKGLPWELAKAFDQSAAIGKFIPVDKKKLYETSFALHKNRKEVQSGHTSDLIFSFEKIIQFVSRFFILEAGDLIFTGTPKGVGPVVSGDQLTGFLNGERLLEQAIL